MMGFSLPKIQTNSEFTNWKHTTAHMAWIFLSMLILIEVNDI